MSAKSTTAAQYARAFVAVIGCGLALGLAVVSPAGLSLSAVINIGACVAITLIDPLAGLLIWLFLSPLVMSANLSIDLGAGIPDLSLGRLTIALIMLNYIAAVAVGKQDRPRLTSLDKWIAVTLLVLSASVIRGENLVRDAQNLIGLFLMPFLTYFVCKHLISTRRQLDLFLSVVVALGTYCAIYGIYTQATGHVLFTTDTNQNLQYSTHLRMMRGLLNSPHAFGLVFSLVIPVSLYKVINERTPWKRLAYLFANLLCLVALLLTYKRGAWLGMLAGFLVMQQLYGRFRRLFLVLFIVSILVIGLNWEAVSQSALVTERLTLNIETGGSRLPRWEEAIDLWLKSPLLGYGWDGYRRNATQYEAVESTYVWILLSAGLLGILPFLIVLLLVLRDAIRLYRTEQRLALVDRDLLAAAIGSFVAYLVNIAPVHMNSTEAVTLTWALVGVLVGAPQLAMQREATPTQRGGV